MGWGGTLCTVTQWRFLLSGNALSPPFWRDQTTVAREAGLTFIPLSEIIEHCWFTFSCPRNIIPCNFNAKCKQKLFFHLQQTLYCNLHSLNKWRYIEQKRKISYFKGFHLGIIMWALYLVVAFLDFSPCVRNAWLNAGCLQGSDKWWDTV